MIFSHNPTYLLVRDTYRGSQPIKFIKTPFFIQLCNYQRTNNFRAFPSKYNKKRRTEPLRVGENGGEGPFSIKMGRSVGD